MTPLAEKLQSVAPRVLSALNDVNDAEALCLLVSILLGLAVHCSVSNDQIKAMLDEGRADAERGRAAALKEELLRREVAS